MYRQCALGTPYQNRQKSMVETDLNAQDVVVLGQDEPQLAGSKCLHTAGVTGSRPVAPTNLTQENQRIMPEQLPHKAVFSGTKNRVSWDKSRTFVYVVSCDVASKVGVSSQPEVRLATLQTGSPIPLQLFYLSLMPDESVARQCEAWVHDQLKSIRLHGEWFNIVPEDAALVVGDAVEFLGVSA